MTDRAVKAQPVGTSSLDNLSPAARNLVDKASPETLRKMRVDCMGNNTELMQGEHGQICPAVLAKAAKALIEGKTLPGDNLHPFGPYAFVMRSKGYKNPPWDDERLGRLGLNAVFNATKENYTTDRRVAVEIRSPEHLPTPTSEPVDITPGKGAAFDAGYMTTMEILVRTGGDFSKIPFAVPVGFQTENAKQCYAKEARDDGKNDSVSKMQVNRCSGTGIDLAETDYRAWFPKDSKVRASR
jgi:hypothetical protein